MLWIFYGKLVAGILMPRDSSQGIFYSRVPDEAAIIKDFTNTLRRDDTPEMIKSRSRTGVEYSLILLKDQLRTGVAGD